MRHVNLRVPLGKGEVSVDATFKASEANGNDTLVAIVYVQRPRGQTDNFGTPLAEALERMIQRALQDHNPKVIPLVQVVVLDPPPERVTEGKGSEPSW